MRFFTEFDDDAKEINIEGGDAVHIKKVLRKERGDILTLTNSGGYDFVCEITEVREDLVSLKPIEKIKNNTEPKVKLTLFQSLPKSGKMELIIQKCVELGVYEIVPVTTRYCVTKPGKKFQDKLVRYNKISESAAKQSGRGIIPAVKGLMSLDAALEYASGLDICMAAYENEKDIKIKDIVKGKEFVSIGLFIGPEGGFSLYEAESFIKTGIKPISLGHRILRTETAGFTGVTIILNEMGEF